MVIMQSCCCWRTVRRGSFASAIYSSLYFLVITISMAKTLIDENEYLSGNRSMPQSKTILESGNISPTTVRFHITLLILGTLGITCCIILFYGLMKDLRMLLLPWIVNMIVFMIVDVASILYILIMSEISDSENFQLFNPGTALLYTYDFFIFCLNTYSVLCVVSQFQEYTAGRGTAADDNEFPAGSSVRYVSAQQTNTVTSGLSSRKTTTNNDSKTTCVVSPSQSPTTNFAATSDKSPTGRCSRKHVQFPDAMNQTNLTDQTNFMSKKNSLDSGSLNGKNKSKLEKAFTQHNDFQMNEINMTIKPVEYLT